MSKLKDYPITTYRGSCACGHKVDDHRDYITVHFPVAMCRVPDCACEQYTKKQNP